LAYNLSKSHQVRSNKPVKKHKQTKKPKIKTPRPEGEYKCAGCGTEHYLSRHHVYYSRGHRDPSSDYGCVEFLCWKCHQSSEGIHGTNSNGKLDKELKRKHQLRLMNKGITLDVFINLFGRSYV